MRWAEIRVLYPEQWVLVEAIEAHSDGNQRIVEQLAVMGHFADSVTAMRHYQALHQAAPERELYVLHTSREALVSFYGVT